MALNVGGHNAKRYKASRCNARRYNASRHNAKGYKTSSCNASNEVGKTQTAVTH